MALRDLLDAAECRLREEANLKGEIRVHAVYPSAIVYRIRRPRGNDPVGVGFWPWEVQTARFDSEKKSYCVIENGWDVKPADYLTDD